MATLEQNTIRKYFEPAFRIEEPRLADGEQASPVIFSSPHSGRIYPASFLTSSRLPAIQLRSSEDAYVDELFSHVSDQGAPFLHALFPRAYLDLNRHPYELDPKLFAGPLPAFAVTDTLKVKSGLGVLARIVSEGREIYRKPLALNDAFERINHLYFPYHNALRSLMGTSQNLHQQAILIDCHSMPSSNLPRGNLVPPDFVLGNRFDKSCDYELTHLVRSQLQSMGYIVSVNKPYAGGYVTKEYGKPQNGAHVLQIEINRRLYLDERTQEKTDGFHDLKENMRLLTQNIIASCPELSLSTQLAAE